MKSLVTGGAGFIGSHLVGALVARGDEVVVLDDFSTGHRENLAHHDGRIEVVEGDLRAAAAVERAVRDCEHVFHLAAMVSVPQSMQDPLTCHAVNAAGTLHVLDAARRAGARRVVLASSCAVYGDEPTLPKRESSPLVPQSPYAATKLQNEIDAGTFHRAFGLETVCLRFFNVFGPRQDPRSPYAAVVPIWLERMRHGKAPVIFGDGTQTRDFVFVANVVQACLLASTAPKAAGDVFNVASGASVVLTELCAELLRACDFAGSADHQPPRAGDIQHSAASIDAARATLGYEPTVAWREGVARTVAWFRSRT